MSRKVFIFAVVVAVLLSTLVALASAMPLEAGHSSSTQGGSWLSLNVGSLPLPLPIQLAGDGSCGGAGSCPT
jgi:hypothetical protein